MYNTEQLKRKRLGNICSGRLWWKFWIPNFFDEEYLLFRHFLLQNQFAYFKITVKEGWVNRETGKNPIKIQFTDVKMLADVLPTFAKNSYFN